MELNVNKVFSLIMARLKYIVLVAAICGLAFFGITKYFIDEEYTSSAKVLVIMDAEYSKVSEASFVKEAVHSYLEIFNTTKFFTEVAETYNSENSAASITPSQLKRMTTIKASTNQDAPSFSLTVRSTNPDECYSLALAIAEHMTVKSEEYDALNPISIIDTPLKPVIPSSPNIVTNTIMGIFVGAFLMIAILIIKEMFDKKIKNLEDITNNYNYPILGVVPNVSSDEQSKKAKRIIYY